MGQIYNNTKVPLWGRSPLDNTRYLTGAGVEPMVERSFRIRLALSANEGDVDPDGSLLAKWFRWDIVRTE